MARLQRIEQLLLVCTIATVLSLCLKLGEHSRQL